MRHDRNIARPPNEDVTNYRWFVVRVFTGREKQVSEALREHGFWPFYPFRRSWRWRNKFDKARRKKYERETVQTPGYVFIGWPARFVPWHIIGWTPHVLSIVGTDGVPHHLTEQAVRNTLVPLMAKQSQGKWDAPDYAKFMESHAEFSVGDNVEVSSGPFLGQKLKVEDIVGRRALVFADLLGQRAKVKIPLEDLAPLG